ncbi:hypothetical protein PGTUg99_026528 [Puccinia graminis f. sp. tritici]|uniref:Uncharacterized protein n=1 Tax=Puccinia graminis f. sp. tritici TaxID=56615 RepID=A0A5B0M964_PUCGR|nr:hypothetical protein PGTUg99_026528 [Puccinia graminis f. sp. tritici]
MRIFKVTLVLLAISLDRLVTAYHCGDGSPQNVCRVSFGKSEYYIRADLIPVQMDDYLYPGAGKNCRINLTKSKPRGCCPMGTIAPGKFITVARYEELKCHNPL